MEANADVLRFAAEKWVEVFDFEGSGSRPRTLPLKLVLDQEHWINSFHFYFFTPISNWPQNEWYRYCCFTPMAPGHFVLEADV